MIWLIQHKVSFVQQPKYVNCPGIKEIIRSVHVSYKHNWMTAWEHKSLQVLISGNLCLKVKHFSSSGPILVTTQPLSVIHSLPPALCRERTANPKCQVPAGRTQEVQRTHRGPTPLTWWGTEGITKTAVTPAHRLCLRNRLSKPLSVQTMGGDWTKFYRFANIYFQNTPENVFGFLHQHCKQRLLKKLEGGGSLLLPLSPSPPSLPSLFCENCSS